MNEHADPRGHVDAILRELALGLIPEGDAENAWAHIAECTDCAEQLRVARSIYEAALEDGSAHVAAEKLVAHSEEARPLSRIETVHLERCSSCRSDLEVLGATPDIGALSYGEETSAESEAAKEGGERAEDTRRAGPAEHAPRAERRRKPWSWLRRWSLGGSLAIATAAIAFVLLVPRDQFDTSGLVPVQPIEVRIPRGVPDPETFEGAWITALGEYADADYSAAEQELRRALSLDPAHAESWLLLGSSQLLQGREDDALAAFRSAEEFATHERVVAEAEWQQIVAWFARGTVTNAELAELRPRIESIAAGSGLHAKDAQELIARLGSR